MKIGYLTILVLFFCCSPKKESTNNESAEEEDLVLQKVSAQVMDSLNAAYPSYSPDYELHPGAKDLFELSQDYPKILDTTGPRPWKAINFRNEPEKYLKVVLDYCLEGNLEVNFAGQKNLVRPWFHAPWLHFGISGREYVHGLTRERGTPALELHRSQDVPLENWAIGMYNSPGGFTIGQVWNVKEDGPKPENATFPEGTVTFKLLFTDGEVAKVPFLQSTFEWEADIYVKAGSTKKRQLRKVRLLQIDVAIKDSNAGDTGWVFGTFVYDASAPGKTPWEKMIPVGVSWDDDSINSSLINKPGAFVNASLKGSYLNINLIEDPARTYSNQAYLRHHGLGGRLNGPVDNPISSCISCHGRAATFKKYAPFNKNSGKAMPMGNFRLTRTLFTVDEFNRYFNTIKGGSHAVEFDSLEYVTTDYSLQLSAGIRNYFQSVRDQTSASPAMATTSVNAKLKEATLGKRSFLKEKLPEVTRGDKDSN